jgi:hypothetical protein
MPGNVYVYRESESTHAECAPARYYSPGLLHEGLLSADWD